MLSRKRWWSTLRQTATKVLRELLVVIEGSFAQQSDHVVPGQHLLPQQLLRNLADLLLLLRQQVPASRVRLVDDPAHLRVDILGRLLAEGLVQLLVLVLEEEEANLLGHAPLSYHGGGHSRYFIKVVAGPASHCFEMELL